MRQREPDRRHWIMDPAGHRKIWQTGLPEDGSIVNTVFGEAVAIVPPPPDDLNDWVCDYCNGEILTRWGNEPFPVPMDGSNALCMAHFHQQQENPVYDTYGEPIHGSRQGLWPAAVCQCAACVEQTARWFPMLDRAYGQLIREVIASN